jgi:hypothetical protein
LEPRATVPRKKRWKRRKLVEFEGFSAGREREGRDSFLCGLVVGRVAAVRAAGAAFLGAGAERFVDDGLDGARAPPAFSAAAEATLNLFRIPRQVRSRTHGTTDIVVAQNVAGTDNHETARTLGDATSSIFKSATRCKRKSRIFKQFQTDARGNTGMNLNSGVAINQTPADFGFRHQSPPPPPPPSPPPPLSLDEAESWDEELSLLLQENRFQPFELELSLPPMPE